MNIENTFKKIKNSKTLYLLPICLIILIVPLIVFYKKIGLSGMTYEAWPVSEYNSDFFSYYKAKWIMIFTFFSTGAFMYYLYKGGQLKKSIYYIPLFLHMIFIWISGYVSNYKPVSLFGVADRYEGMYILLAYCILTVIVFNLVNKEIDIKFILLSLLISSFIISVIGIFQYFDIDFFRSSFGKHMILPKESHWMAENLEFRFGKYTIYSTLYNTNYVGSFMVMVLFLAIPLTLFIKNIWWKAAGVLFTVLIFANYIGCRSRAGMIGGIVSLVIFGICFRKKLREKGYELFVIVFCSACMIIIMNEFSNGSLFKKISTLGTDIKKLENNTDSKADKVMKSIIVKNVEMDSNNINFTFNNGRNLRVEYGKENENAVIRFFKENNQKIDMAMSQTGDVILSDEIYKKLDVKIRRVRIDKQIYQVLKIKIGKSYPFDFVITDKGFRLVEAKTNELVLPRKVDRVKFLDGKERIGSSRGYIYSRSIPMLKDTIFLGYGPDTYSITFPQDDLLGKVIAYQTTGKVVDKPHCMYLQMGINTGLLSLIAALFMFGLYFFDSFLIYFREEYNDLMSNVGLGIFLGFTGYCIAGVFNDSIVSVAPVFWVLYGMGMAINQYIKNGRKKL